MVRLPPKFVIPPEYTHVTVNEVETAVDLPGLTTAIEVSESTVNLIELPEVTTSLVVSEERHMSLV